MPCLGIVVEGLVDADLHVPGIVCAVAPVPQQHRHHSQGNQHQESAAQANTQANAEDQLLLCG